MAESPIPYACLIGLSQELADLLGEASGTTPAEHGAGCCVGGIIFGDVVEARACLARVEERFGIVVEQSALGSGALTTFEQLLDGVYARLS